MVVVVVVVVVAVVIIIIRVILVVVGPGGAFWAQCHLSRSNATACPAMRDFALSPVIIRMRALRTWSA